MKTDFSMALGGRLDEVASTLLLEYAFVARMGLPDPTQT
jgi:hypothetical protein